MDKNLKHTGTHILELLAEKYGTDKLTHGYIPHYIKHLPKKPKKILEIGCFKGASLRMWRECFPDCELQTLDIFKQHSPPTDIGNLICHTGSQSDIKVLSMLKDYDFDVIIDDGSHNSHDQNTSFDYLFKNALKRKGLYVVEDLHCCTEEFYRRGMKFEETILGRIKQANASGTSGTLAPAFPYRHHLYLDKIAFIHAD